MIIEYIRVSMDLGDIAGVFVVGLALGALAVLAWHRWAGR